MICRDCWATSEVHFASMLTVTYHTTRKLNTESTKTPAGNHWMSVSFHLICIPIFNSNNQACPFYKVALHLDDLEWTECACLLSGHMDTLCCAILWAKVTVRRAHALTEKKPERMGAALFTSRCCIAGWAEWRMMTSGSPLQTNTSNDCFRQDIHWNNTFNDVYI